jgi:hypothetical protein
VTVLSALAASDIAVNGFALMAFAGVFAVYANVAAASTVNATNVFLIVHLLHAAFPLMGLSRRRGKWFNVDGGNNLKKLAEAAFRHAPSPPGNRTRRSPSTVRACVKLKSQKCPRHSTNFNQN